MELRETEWAIEQPIFGNIMEATVDSQDISHTSPVSGILSTPSIHSSSPLSPPSLSSHPPSRPCRPKHPPKTSYLPSRPPLPTSAPLLLSPPVSKPPAHIPTKSAPLLVSPPLPSNPPSLALPTTLSPTMVSISPLLSLQASVSHDLSPTSTPAALPLSLSSTASFASSSLLPPPLPVMPPFSSSPPLLSPIDCLLGTTSVWQPKGLSLHQINIILEKENAGVFVVHTEDYSMTVSVRLPDEHKAPLVHSVMVKQHKTFVHLDGSSLVFDDIFKLISFYCVSRDILAVTLMLPLAIATATKREELETISAMGADFWTSDLNQKGGAAIGTDADSCSTSSTEEEAESLQEQEQNHNRPTESHKAAMKRTSTTVMLDRARYRLSTVLTGLISHDRRLTQRIVEMARAPTSYIGNLVKEHRAFTLETMSNHLTSTELLQEIRQMMTQLRSYLLQSAELQALLEPQHQYSQDKIENIVEAAMCKSVLKPLREPIYQSLEKLHTANGSLKQLAQNQSVVLGSTTTALGITTAVPEASAMEKISIKLNNLHLEYSPQKKIELLLKACKIIYDAMSVSCPGRAYGADDFLPVMMYVLARSNLSALQLDVEYMMELMDPSLTLGEGSYYLTTTYGALEHIKTFDQQRSATRQLSREVQDSIHRWERRRTLNKESMSQGSVRDFLTVCCPDIEANPKTLGVLPNTTIQQLSEQCTTRFEQSEESYTLSVYIDGLHQPLAPTELALSVKNSCQPGTYCFVYHPIGQSNNKPSRTCPSDPPPAPPAENLITANTRPVAPEAEEEILIEL
ncbi:ras and Rab interactor 3 isoform X8 [Betta splendens]|uniref:Ras and Rab interactor 3 isoform X8 n=1 Tax=Betta splendens TaxID=158456 RepID=A0A9W2XIM4_BETSP|nr:ras and Rab interactor 3 isoform X8 [Betta splendens]